MQYVQNCLARVVTKSPRRTSSSPLLASLHWLPIRSRIRFKINLLTYKAITIKQPQYLTNLLKIRSISFNLRNNQGVKLCEPNVKGYSSHAYANHAPTLWNSLPYEVRSAPSIPSFKKSLKTQYFKHPP